MRRVAISILTILVLMLVPSYAYSLPGIYGVRGVALEVKSGDVLYDKKAHEKSYPASVTKVLTAILLDEYVKADEDLVVSEYASIQECSCLVLEPGEVLTKRDAMHALLIKSANDVATVIAEHIAGSEESFSDLMNQKAQEIGMTNSHFVTPNGLHHEDHYTTAYDLALLGKEALNYPSVIQAMGTTEYTVHTSKQTIPIYAIHKVMDQPDALAGKTGYTSMAQNTLLEIFQKGHNQIVTVVLKTSRDQEYQDVNTMAQYGFSLLKEKKVIQKGDVLGKEEVYGKTVELHSTEDLVLTLRKEEKASIHTEIELRYPKGKDLGEGDVIGEALVYNDGEFIQVLPLAISEQVIYEKENREWVTWAGLVIPLLFYLTYEARRKKGN
ncbi:D-alanyl-D-alanine carboxypeptidase (plasmid) [Pontibacillus sp. ALD_SL1]|uniref:D-alanyl-D-alanine carboxypeptidase family protein n=1 Tax=Pontibacillus sp. ALD_SL1 TaxID=2777185 RepID=UPI001A964527|nr:D-alanyl-D-alanine carboxypeptidase family protein [Pontibacillus sp. ALD_SL1]QST03087.1 D-alanyl-D-alanine carboxypeptidase [Pontibacillus sp. ALD_SL1]